jgi:hypothetical protein
MATLPISRPMRQVEITSSLLVARPQSRNFPQAGTSVPFCRNASLQSELRGRKDAMGVAEL